MSSIMVVLKAGPVVDALIAEKVMGMPFRKPTHGTCCTCQTCGHPNDSACQCGYSEYIEMAWPVVEKLINEKIWNEFTMIEDCDQWKIWNRHYGPEEDSDPLAYAATAPLAICLAALKAVGVSI